ncbi:MAG: thioredoxin [Opitutales bacterium]|jgi:thioredoxin 1|nr:thioredoxin [Opitutales bacterium]
MAEGILNVTETNFDSTLSGATKPVLVDFWAPWCGPCRSIAPILEQLAAEMPDEVQIVKVNVDEAQGLAQRYNIRAIPTLLFIKDSEVKDQAVGLVQKEQLAQKIRALA